MARRLYSVEEVAASMQERLEMPGPVDDICDLSADEFEGYVDSEYCEGDGEGCEGDTECGRSDERREMDAVGSEGEGGDITDGHAVCGGDIPEYTSTPGCTQPAGDGSPLQYFKMLVTDTMLDSIVRETNLYATQYISTHTITPHSRVQQWSRQEFDRDELKRFLALVIVMGLVNLPSIEDHWVTTWPYSSSTCSSVCCEIIT